MRVIPIRVLAAFFIFTGVPAHASIESLDFALGKLSGEYQSLGGPAKALNQLRCFVRSHGFRRFRTKPAGDLAGRCNSRPHIGLESERGVTIVDYTVASDRPRYFLFDLLTQTVRVLHVSHGRFGDTPRNNTKLSHNPKRNSILKAVHFSNTPGLNASAGGFYLTGHEYNGSYGRSMVLHGLEEGVNDNACLRATVVHPSSHIKEAATLRMSSGCPMLARTQIDYVIDRMKDGAFFYIYTPDEARLDENTCGRNLLL